MTRGNPPTVYPNNSIVYFNSFHRFVTSSFLYFGRGRRGHTGYLSQTTTTNSPHEVTYAKKRQQPPVSEPARWGDPGCTSKCSKLTPLVSNAEGPIRSCRGPISGRRHYCNNAKADSTDDHDLAGAQQKPTPNYCDRRCRERQSTRPKESVRDDRLDVGNVVGKPRDSCANPAHYKHDASIRRKDPGSQKRHPVERSLRRTEAVHRLESEARSRDQRGNQLGSRVAHYMVCRSKDRVFRPEIPRFGLEICEEPDPMCARDRFQFGRGGNQRLQTIIEKSRSGKAGASGTTRKCRGNERGMSISNRNRSTWAAAGMDDSVKNRGDVLSHGGARGTQGEHSLDGGIPVPQRRPVQVRDRNGFLRSRGSSQAPSEEVRVAPTRIPINRSHHSTGVGRTQKSQPGIVGSLNQERSSCPSVEKQRSPRRDTSHCEAQGPGNAVSLSPPNGSRNVLGSARGDEVPPLKLFDLRKYNRTLVSAVFPLKVGSNIMGSSNEIFAVYPEPIDLGHSQGSQVGIKSDMSRTVHRPPCKRVFRNQGRLAPITTNKINLGGVFSLADELGLTHMVEPLAVIRDVKDFKAHLKSSTLPGRRPVSRFMDIHLDNMIEYDVVSQGKGIFTMPSFTTPKKDGSLRLILDCRPLNLLFEKPPDMLLPRIRTLIDLVLEANMFAQCDAVSYFYQFELAMGIPDYFGSRLGQGRGNYVDVLFNRMPMGWSWAPALGQRVANTLIHNLGVAWVDNFILLAHNQMEFQNRRSEFRKRLERAHLQVDKEELEPQTQGTILGIEFDLLRKRFRMDPEWVHKAQARIQSIIQKGNISIEELYVLSGTLVWRSHVTGRKLCNMPHLFQALGKFGQKVGKKEMSWDDKFEIDPALKIELVCETEILVANNWIPKTQATADEGIEIWSDASDTHWAYIIYKQGEIVSAKRGPTKDGYHIYYAELSAAIAAIMDAKRHGHKRIRLYIDNAAAALAIQRGVSSNFSANRWLSHIQDMSVEVVWVPTTEQRADYLTRAVNGSLPDLPFIQRPWGKDLKSNL